MIPRNVKDPLEAGEQKRNNELKLSAGACECEAYGDEPLEVREQKRNTYSSGA